MTTIQELAEMLENNPNPDTAEAADMIEMILATPMPTQAIVKLLEDGAKLLTLANDIILLVVQEANNPELNELAENIDLTLLPEAMLGAAMFLERGGVLTPVDADKS